MTLLGLTFCNIPRAGRSGSRLNDEVSAMVDPIQEIKVRAEILQKRIEAGEPAAQQRLGILPELRNAPLDTMKEFAATIQRKHCLTVLARELGFSGYPHALRVLAGEDEADFGTTLYPGGHGMFNHWYANYEEARELRTEIQGYLLAYKRHFFIVDKHFIESLGLDPADPDWDAMGRDWVKPEDPDARRRLYGKLIQARA